MSVTDVDDGDASTAEAWCYLRDTQTGVTLWAMVQTSVYDPPNVWAYGDGASGMASNRSPGFDRILNSVSPSVLARPDACSGVRPSEWVAEGGKNAIIAAGGAAYPCLLSEVMFFGCVGGAAAGGFFATLFADFWSWAWMCAFYQ